MVVHGANVIRKRIKQREKELLTAEPARLSWIHGAIFDLQWVIEDEQEKVVVEESPAAAEEQPVVQEPKPEPAQLETFDSAKPEQAPAENPPAQGGEIREPTRKPICSLYDEQPELNESGYPTGTMEGICNETDLDAACPEDETCRIKEGREQLERLEKEPNPKDPESQPAPEDKEIIG